MLAPIQAALSRIGGYGIVNARISFNLDLPQIEIAGFVRNAPNNKYYTHTFRELYSTPLATAIAFPGAPRVYGISLAYHFRLPRPPIARTFPHACQ